MLRRTLWVAVVVGCCALPTRAVLIAYDGFNYPPSSNLGGQNGGSGFSTPWALGVAATVAAGSLSSGALQTTGNSVFTQAPTESLNRTLNFTLGTPGTSAYFSFLVQSPTTPDPNLSYGLGLLGTIDNLFIGKASFPPANSQYVLERFHGPGQVSSGVTAVAGATVLLVVHADFTAGNDTFRLYVNPTPGGSEPATANAVKNDFDFGTFNAVQINGTATYLFDELRIGTTYADAFAIPEPGIGLLTLGLLPLVRRGRLSAKRRSQA